MAKNNNLLLVAGAAVVALFAFSGGSKKKKAPSEDLPDEEYDSSDDSSEDLPDEEYDDADITDEGPGIEGSGAAPGPSNVNYDNLEKFNREFVRAVALIAATHARPINSEVGNALSSFIQRNLHTWIKLHQSRMRTNPKKIGNLKPTTRTFNSYPDKMQYEVSEFLKANLNAADLGLNTSLNSDINKVKKDAVPKINVDALMAAGNLNKRYNIPWESTPGEVNVVKALQVNPGVSLTPRSSGGSRTNSGEKNQDSLYVMIVNRLPYVDKSLSGVMKKALPVAVESAINSALSGKNVPSIIKKQVVDLAKRETKEAIDKAAKASKIDHVDHMIEELLAPVLTNLPSMLRSQVKDKIDENLVKAINSLTTRAK